jgi:hypothetical protein
MNRTWTHSLKTAYRKEPISSFILTVGAVDATIGGIGTWGSLLALGLTVMGIAGILRWLILRNHPVKPPIESAPIRYLLDRSSRPSLPLLGLSEPHE